MLFHLSRGLHVVMWLKIERGDRGIDIAARQGGLGLSCAHGRGADAEISQPYVEQFFAVGARAGGQPDNRVIAMTPCQFGKTGASIFTGRRYPDRSEHILWSERG